MAYTGSKALQGIGTQLSIGPVASAVAPTGLTGTTTTSSPNITLSGTPSGSVVGMGISGTGIPANTTIISGSGTTYVMSANASATGSTGSLTFTVSFTPIFELTNLPFKPGEWDKLEVSNFNSLNSAKEYIKGMIDSGTFPFEGNAVSSDPGQIALRAAFADKANAYQFQLTLPKQQGQVSTGDSYTFNALVMQYTALGELDPKKPISIKGEAQITGAPTYTAGT